MVTNFIIDYAYGVELNLPATLPAAGVLIPFKNQNQFDVLGLKIVGCESYTRDQLGYSPSGNQLITAAGCLNIGVTFYDKSTQIAQLLPFNEFNPVVNNGFVKSFGNGFEMNWQRSGVTMFNTGGITASQSVYFTFFAKLK